MKLRILSDLHLGHRRDQFELEEVEHDVLVCVGDVRGSITDGIEVLRKISKRPVVFIAGNHEFYGFEGASLEEAYVEGRERAGESGSVHLLENKAVVLDEVRFLGTTLWTDYALYGEEYRERAMKVACNGLNDHRHIRLRKPGGASRAFLPSDALAMHRKAVQWLSGALCEPFDGPTVVCTIMPLTGAPWRRSSRAIF
jgi:DNA repair exonuclease SbcCD nuclease subunit